MPVARPTVGVLDDEPEMRKALRRLLICRGFQVMEYERGADLLDALDSHPLDCLLLDLHMEGVNGFEVLGAFLARQIHVPIIVITAHDEPGTAEQVRHLGAVAYLKKPVDRDALFASVSAALAHRESPSPSCETTPP